MESADESGLGTQRPRPIASQACNTCRARKTKCDENRPRCGLCERVNTTCVYQEPKPVKKDKTLQEILSTLEVLHQKVDRLGSDRTRDRKADLAILAASHEIVDKTYQRKQTLSTTSRQSHAIPAPPEVKRILSWPAIAKILRSDLDELHNWENNHSSIEEWLSRITEEFGRQFVIEGRVDIVTEDAPYFKTSGVRTLPLSNELINDLAAAFFASFHCMYPILDRHQFFDITLPQAKSRGFDESDEASPLVLLVLALGSVAQQGAIGPPVLEQPSGRETGIRGGEVQKPPGLQLLHEAHRRMGLLLPECTLTLLQCHLLSAIYYSQCSRNLEYWRLTEKSCTLCESLYKLGRGWGTKDMQIFNRSFWMCVLLESGPTGELGLSRTHITELQDEIQDPKTLLYSLEKDPEQHQDYLIGHHFLAQVYLRTLLNQINNDLRSTRSLLSDADQGAPTPVIKALAQYLQDWRAKLPPELNWDGDATLCTTPETFPENVYVSLDGEGFSYNMLDPMLILTASLQTRYKYALYLIYRPYIYKALHYPEAMTQEDLIGCQKALHACTRWPLLLSFFQEQKRLLPHLYEYSHTFFSILVLLYVCKSSAILEPILRSDSLMDAIEESTGPLLLWLRDMQVVHPVASWCWTLIKVLYREHPVVKD